MRLGKLPWRTCHIFPSRHHHQPGSWRREKDAGLQAARCDPKNQVVFDAYRRRQYNKAVALISTIPATERCGELGDTFLKAYRNLIQQWKTKERPAVALKWSAEMIENLPDVSTMSICVATTSSSLNLMPLGRNTLFPQSRGLPRRSVRTLVS